MTELPTVMSKAKSAAAVISGNTPIALGFGLTIVVFAYQFGQVRSDIDAQMRDMRKEMSQNTQRIADQRSAINDQMRVWVQLFRAQAAPEVRAFIPEYPK